ncbi:MAG: cytochrome c [Planctomycetota bacterium]|nr:cytochrome c [Planctomycetota bacterium]
MSTAVSVGVWFCLTAPKSNQAIIKSKSDQLGSQPSQPNTPHELPNNPQTVIRQAGTFRKQGRDIEAFAEVQLLSNDEATSEPNLLEQIELAFDQSRYEDALDHLAKIGLSSPDDFRKMLNQGFRFMVERQPSDADPLFHKAQLGAMALAFGGKRPEAEEVFAETLNRIARLRRINDLRHRMATSVNRPEIELERSKLLNAESFAPVTKHTETEPGIRLYKDKCSHCHGESGAGNGRAARHLFPSPRNFLGQRFRYVSASNGLATDSDLINVIRSGLPGTSMPAFPELSNREWDLLLPVLREFHRLGVEASLKGLALSKDELDDLLAAKTRPTKQLDIPVVPNDFEAAIRRGELLFQTTGCRHCHTHPGASQYASNRIRHFDESGHPILARDLSTDPLKGGESLDDIYRRIALGIPGTPHPSFAGSPSETMDLATYVLSIANDEKSPSTNDTRRRRLVDSSFKGQP